MELVRLEVSQGVTKKCRLSWLTNSALVYEPKWGVSANEYRSCAHGAQINFGDLTTFFSLMRQADNYLEVTWGEELTKI